MIGAFISMIFNFVLGLLATVIQIIVWPINTAIDALMPDFSSWVLQVAQGFQGIVQSLTWPLQLIPLPLLATFAFIFTVLLVIRVFSISNHALVKVWTILQKIKFW